MFRMLIKFGTMYLNFIAGIAATIRAVFRQSGLVFDLNCDAG